MVIWEIPSNFVGQRIGPNYWVPVIQVIWGVVTMTQACLVNRAGFLATRFLLATFEAGFIPGMAWYLTGFYCTNELAFRLAIYWGANSVASIISGIVALGLLSLSGKNGRHGWEYLFLIEGGLTIFVALAAFFLLVSPSTRS